VVGVVATAWLPLASLYEWLMLAHVLAAMVWLGGGVVLCVLAVSVLRAAESAAVAQFVADLRLVGPRVLAPAMVAVLGFGIWMVLDSAAWDFRQLWVQLGLGLFAAAFLIGAVYQSRMALAAERAAGRGDDDEARRQLTRWTWGYGVTAVLVLVATWDMVTKPGL
jgi:uncharacterized membrane protein